jgi:hypothetical protein
VNVGSLAAVPTRVPRGAVVLGEVEEVEELAGAESEDAVGDAAGPAVVLLVEGSDVVDVLAEAVTPVVSVAVVVPVVLVAAGVSSATATAGAASRAASATRPADSERARGKDVFMGPLRKG